MQSRCNQDEFSLFDIADWAPELDLAGDIAPLSARFIKLETKKIAQANDGVKPCSNHFSKLLAIPSSSAKICPIAVAQILKNSVFFSWYSANCLPCLLLRLPPLPIVYSVSDN
jgi:hypothetical protein